MISHLLCSGRDILVLQCVEVEAKAEQHHLMVFLQTCKSTAYFFSKGLNSFFSDSKIIISNLN